MSVMILIPDQNIVRSAKSYCVTYENDTFLRRQKLLIIDQWTIIVSLTSDN